MPMEGANDDDLIILGQKASWTVGWLATGFKHLSVIVEIVHKYDVPLSDWEGSKRVQMSLSRMINVGIVRKGDHHISLHTQPADPLLSMARYWQCVRQILREEHLEPDLTSLVWMAGQGLSL